MDKPRNFIKNSFHHVYNRGVNKENIFFEKDDYFYFLNKIHLNKKKYSIKFLAYCLMPNHFHFFVMQETDEFTISDFMSSLLNSYTKHINNKYQRSGTLFESKFKSKLIDNEKYFIWLIKYILNNPEKAGLVENYYEWDFSNAKDLLGLRNGKLCNNDEVKEYFQSFDKMKEFLSNDEERFSEKFY